jgi:hypothetical protein
MWCKPIVHIRRFHLFVSKATARVMDEHRHGTFGPTGNDSRRSLSKRGYSVTDNFTERIHKELAGSLGDLPWLSVHVREGWGDIFYVTVSIRGATRDDCEELRDTLNSAVDRALGEARHLVEIKWER